MAVMLENGKIVTGKQSNLMSAASAAVLNCIKVLARLPDELHLISPNVIEPIISLKGNTLSMKHTMLSLNEILLALAVSAASNDVVAYAMSKLSLLKGCEAHCTHMVGQEDESLLLKLRVNLTCSLIFHQKICFINNRKRNERLYCKSGSVRQIRFYRYLLFCSKHNLNGYCIAVLEGKEQSFAFCSQFALELFTDRRYHVMI